MDAPAFQVIQLAGSPGRLPAHLLARQDLRGLSLVTLSACETGLGRFDRADNLRGIPAAPEAVSGDADLRAFVLAEQARTSYWLVQFTCTFEHDDDLPFATAWLQLNLIADGGSAIAHSMEPARLATSRTISWSVKLVVPVVLQPEVGIAGEHTTEEVFCEASREGTAQPAWKFFRTSSSIRGLQRMRLVVRTPSASGLSATIRVGATVSHQRFGRKSLSYDMLAQPPRPWLAMPSAVLGNSGTGS